MFLKIIAFIVACSIFSASAMSNSNDGLKAAFDEFTYSVTVEWDQKDASFLEAKKLELMLTISGLEAEGMTRAELITFAKSQLKDARLIANLDSVLEAISLNKMTAEEAQNFMIRSIQNSQSQGAGWNGVIILTPVGLLILVLLIAVIVD